METTATIIGVIILLIILIPFYISVRSQSIKKEKIKKIFEKYSKNNFYNFSLTTTQNKKVLAIDENKKGFLFIDFNSKPEDIVFIDLSEIDNCKLHVSTENNSEIILKIEFEFQNKQTQKKELVPFYKIENDQLNQVCLYEDHQLAKKWVAIIEKCIL